MTRITVYGAFCVLVGLLNGGIVLLNLSFKWKFAFLGLLGIAVLMLVVGDPKKILLFGLAFTVSITFEKALIVSPERFSLTRGAGINLSDVLVLMLLLLSLAKRSMQKTEHRFFSSTTLPVLMWLILSSFSLLAAIDTQLVLIQLINMFKLLLLCLVVASSVESEVDVTLVIAGFLLSMLFQSGVGIYQGVTGHPVGLGFLDEKVTIMQQNLGEETVNRVQGTMGHPNSYGLYLTTIIPFVLALLLSKAKRSLKLFAAVTLCLAVLALIYSLSRSAWITFVVIVGIILTLAVRRKLIGLGTALVVLGITGLALIGLTFFGPDVILNRITGNDQGSAYSRVILAKTALAMIKDHPWIGVGLNNYTLASPQYDTGPYVLYVVHNVYLLIAAETGFIGLMAFLVLLVILLIRAWQIINGAVNDTMWIAGAGIFCAFVAVAVFSIVDYSLLGASQATTQFGLLTGLAASLSHRTGPKQQDYRQLPY